MHLYLAGPMTGYPNKNFPLFFEVAKDLRTKGHTVWSPAEPDPVTGFDPVASYNEHMNFYMSYELPEVCRADAVAVLPGWEASRGANIEIHVARCCDIPIVDAYTLEPVLTPNKWGL